jgi:hypothetical protein
MIRINLLPEEFRRSERTSPKLFAAVLGSVMCVCCAFGWFGFVYFGELGRHEMQLATVTEELNTLKPQERRQVALTKELSDYQKRATTIEQISRGRILWSRYVDRLIDLVNGDGSLDGPRPWLRQLKVTPGKPGGRGKAGRGPTVMMPGWVQGGQITKLSDYLDQLAVTQFFPYVANKDLYPEGQRVVDPSRTPQESLAFNLTLEMLPAPAWHAVPANQAAPAKRGK